jgi:hypothetical protein
MLSTPPATIAGAPSTMMRCAAIAMACRPDEQKRLTVTPAVVTGSPARSAMPRARCCRRWCLPAKRAAHDHVLDLGRVDAGALDGVLIAWPPSVAP